MHFDACLWNHFVKLDQTYHSWEDIDTEELQSQFMQVKGDNVYFYRSCHYHYVNKDATNYLARLYINIYLSLLTKYKHVFTFNK
jgi:hypothetical protein